MAPYPHAKGFTLIEMVCVITVLSILAATAIPKFADLTKEARIAKLNALASALHTTAQLWNVVCLLQSDTKCLKGPGSAELTRNGVTAEIYQGYPNAGDVGWAHQIETLISTNGFTVTKPAQYYNLFSIPDAPTPSKCSVIYCDSNKDNTDMYLCYLTTYRVTVETSGC